MRHINLRIGALLLFFAGLTLSACNATLRSTVDTADHANLDGFKTYAWITDKPLFNSSTLAPEVVNPLNEQRIRMTIEEELERKIEITRFNGERYSQSVQAIPSHVVNHGTNHRAQMLQLIHSYDGETFEQDMTFYFRHQQNI